MLLPPALAQAPLNVGVSEINSDSALITWTLPQDPIPLSYWVVQYRRLGTMDNWSQQQVAMLKRLRMVADMKGTIF